MRIVCCTVLLAAMVAGGCASSEAESAAQYGYDFSGLDRVAIIEVTGAVGGDGVKNWISDQFVKELLTRGYKVIERSQVQSLLAEQEFQASDITTDQGAAKAGRVLNVPAVMVINIPKYRDDLMAMTAKLIDVEDGAILWLGEGTGGTGRGAATLMGAVLGAAIGAAATGGDTEDRVVGGVVGGVLGGVAGHALSPQQEQALKQIIKKVVKDLPPRVARPANE